MRVTRILATMAAATAAGQDLEHAYVFTAAGYRTVSGTGTATTGNRFEPKALTSEGG